MTNFPKITLKAARVNAHLSLKMASKALGITVNTLKKYERGQSVPAWDLVYKMEKTYQYPMDFIFFSKFSL